MPSKKQGARERESKGAKKFVSGHDFSRAESAAKTVWALAPAERLFAHMEGQR
jgi:hypothetical protein